LGEAVARCQISADDFDIAFSENVGDGPWLSFHMLSLYAAGKSLSPIYPRLNAVAMMVRFPNRADRAACRDGSRRVATNV
jgi:hypothetical protein